MAGEGGEDSKAQRMPDDARLDRAVDPEYAAVSGAAIGSLILAAVAVAAFLPVPVDLPLPWTWFRLPLFLVLPLAAIALAMAAIRLIRRSEGTRIGIRLAQAALVLAIVETLGAAAFHTVRQYGHYTVQQALVGESRTDLQYVLDGDFEALFRKLVANDPSVAKAERQIRAWWRQTQTYMRSGGGDYFGRALQSCTRRVPETEEDGPYEIGFVSHRLMFADGALDVFFRYQLVDGQWQLTYANSQRKMLTIPKEGDKPKKRFEE
jgi:hypothetical protein